MKLFTHISLLAVLIFCHSSTAFAAANDASGGGGSIPAGQSNQQSAGQASGGAGMAMAMNAAMGAAMAVPCATTMPPGNIPFCVMALQSFMQVAETGKAKKAANNTRAGFNSDFGNPDGIDTPTPNNEFGPFKPDLTKLGIKDELGLYQYTQTQIDKLNTKGFKYDPKTDTFTTPDGKAFSSSAFASPQAMADAGMSKAAIDEAMQLTKAVADKYKVSAIGLAGGGGGGGGSSSSGRSGSNYDPYADLYGSLRDKPQAAKTTGLSRTLASGESIGTQSDSIFEMVKRCYKRKTAENIFVGADGK